MDCLTTICFDNNFLEKTKKSASGKYKEFFNESLGEEEAKGLSGIRYENVDLSDVDYSFDDGTLTIWGDFSDGEGSIELKFNVPIEISKDLLEYSIKQMNKIKTVIEAVK